jgi:hypothetical protein
MWLAAMIMCVRRGSNGKQKMSLQVVRWDVSMLPKAATCYNALQLPPYPSEGIMRQVSAASWVHCYCQL